MYFTVSTFLGEYRVGVKFNDKHIPDSPFRVYISPEQGDAHKIEIGQFPESGCAPNKPQAFIVRKNGAKGEFDAKVNSNIQILNCLFLDF
jgi:filamin